MRKRRKEGREARKRQQKGKREGHQLHIKSSGGFGVRDNQGQDQVTSLVIAAAISRTKVECCCR